MMMTYREHLASECVIEDEEVVVIKLWEVVASSHIITIW